MLIKKPVFIIPLALAISVSASILFPAFAGEDGKAEYDKTCLACHASASRLVKKIPGTDSVKKQEFLEAYLLPHHAPDASVRQAIIAYLLSL